MQESRNRVHDFYEKPHDEVIEVGVSIDGTWMKRGYMSKYRVVAAICMINFTLICIFVYQPPCLKFLFCMATLVWLTFVTQLTHDLKIQNFAGFARN